jgi:cobalt/nickel transport system ATP-binding protein
VHHSIVVRELSYTYPDGHPALRGVTFGIAPGEKVALVGPNGAGKSTLLLHLNGILRGQGSIEVCGQQLSDATLSAIRSAVGMVFQDPDDQLFSPTVFDDVAFGPIYQGLPEPEIRSRVREALSSGEKKRIAIATVLSMRPEVLALDEPTSDLDPRSRRELIRLLGDVPMTMLVSTHDLRMVQELLPRSIILDQGRIAADGPTAELLADAALLEAHGLEAP